MKYLPLVLRNLLRNKRRSGLTAFAIFVSTFLVVALRTALYQFENPPSEQSRFRLVARHATSLQNPLPETHVDKIRKLPGILETTPLTWFGAYWKDENNWFPNFEIEADTFWDVFPEVRLPEEEKRAFLADLQGCFVGRDLAAKFDWKVGDRIVLTGQIYPLNPELNVRGIYDGPDSTWLLFHRKYVEKTLETSAGRPGRVGTIWFLVAGPEDVAPVSARVDAAFRNSDGETKTETEKAFQLSFVEMMGDLRAIVRNIVAAVALTMLLVAGNAMAMAARERAAEAAVLRALGFPPARVGFLFLSEAVLVAGIGGLLGTLLPVLLFFDFSPEPIMFPTFRVPTGIAASGILLALLVGALAGGLPAWSLVRRPIAQALRRA